MTLTPLLPHHDRAAGARALLEDLGRAGDITTDAIVPADPRARWCCRAPARRRRRPRSRAHCLPADRSRDHCSSPSGPTAATSQPGDVIADHRRARRAALLTAERTALNFLCRLSGIATATASLVAAVQGTKARIVCTRKTTPGLRALEKYAVRAGGGSNHRFGLDDAVLIKDNHIAIAGGIRTAIERAGACRPPRQDRGRGRHAGAARRGAGARRRRRAARQHDARANCAQAVGMVGGRAITEASGRITPATAPAIAATGVDLISIGWLTHSAARSTSGSTIWKPAQQGIRAARRRSIACFSPAVRPARPASRCPARRRRAASRSAWNDRERQHHDRDRLMRQSQIDRHLTQQREDAERGLQKDRRDQPPGAADDGRSLRATARHRWRAAAPGPAAHRRSCDARTAPSAYCRTGCATRALRTTAARLTE